jgi:hypothetical protein
MLQLEARSTASGRPRGPCVCGCVRTQEVAPRALVTLPIRHALVDAGPCSGNSCESTERTNRQRSSFSGYLVRRGASFVIVDARGSQPLRNFPTLLVRGTLLAPAPIMHRALLVASWSLCIWAGLIAGPPAGAQSEGTITYRLEVTGDDVIALRKRFTELQLGILEKLNRAELDHLSRLRAIVVPKQWVADELAYAVLPEQYPSAARHGKLLVVHTPGQVFGAYESGRLARWGPISSGARASPTPEACFF